MVHFFKHVFYTVIDLYFFIPTIFNPPSICISISSTFAFCPYFIRTFDDCFNLSTLLENQMRDKTISFSPIFFRKTPTLVYFHYIVIYEHSKQNFQKRSFFHQFLVCHFLHINHSISLGPFSSCNEQWIISIKPWGECSSFDSLQKCNNGLVPLKTRNKAVAQSFIHSFSTW